MLIYANALLLIGLPVRLRRFVMPLARPRNYDMEIF